MSVLLSKTTPVHYLVLLDHITVLRHLYGRVIIPQAVGGEVQQEGTPATGKAWVAAHPDWLEVRPVSAALDATLAFLDVGEREAMAVAKAREADARIIDEPEGREAARQRRYTSDWDAAGPL